MRRSYTSPVDHESIHTSIAQERRRIADLIDDLDEAALATPSLCAGWDVRTVGAHLICALTDGPATAVRLAIRRGSLNRAIDEITHRKAELPTAEITATLRNLADFRYWRLPPKAPGILAETLAHSGDIRIPLGLPFEPDPQLIAVTMDFLTGPVPIGLVPPRRLRGIRWHATDIGQTWGKGPEIRGRAAELIMGAVGRHAVLDALDGPGLALLRQRISD